jgi:hypothetical protein
MFAEMLRFGGICSLLHLEVKAMTRNVDNLAMLVAKKMYEEGLVLSSCFVTDLFNALHNYKGQSSLCSDMSGLLPGV